MIRSSCDTKILLVGSQRTFLKDFRELINRLGSDYDIFVVLTMLEGVEGPKDILTKLRGWISADAIKGFCVLPPTGRRKKFYRSMKELKSNIQDIGFTVCVLQDEIQIENRLIASFVKPKTKIVVYWPMITFLLMRHSKLFFEKINQRANGYGELLISRQKSKIKKAVKNPLKPLLLIIKRITKLVVVKPAKHLIEYKVWPFLNFGITFSHTKKDVMTQMGSGKADAYLLTDPVEVEVHRKFFGVNTVHLINPEHNSYCTCMQHGRDKKIPAILCPLSGWEHENKIPELYLSSLVRDLQTVLLHENLTKVVIRKHPDFNRQPRWSNQLSQRLEKNGFETAIENCETSIESVACKYPCVAGFAGSALRAVRLSCKNIRVVAFEMVSSVVIDSPKFVFGSSEGIGWINTDGTINNDTFAKSSLCLPERPTLNEKIVQISKIKK